ncbi:hypothetical protein TNCV_4125361 [Trichonephila clavipes]|nr:hypothetical protein TNCV_4125361 [Trichonephila clavipes]
MVRVPLVHHPWHRQYSWLQNLVHLAVYRQSASKDDQRLSCVPTNRSSHCHTICNRRRPFDNKCLIGPVAWLPPHSYALVIGSETESGFFAEDHTPLVGNVPASPSSRKLQSALLMMVSGSVVCVLMVNGFLYLRRPVVSNGFP